MGGVTQSHLCPVTMQEPCNPSPQIGKPRLPIWGSLMDFPKEVGWSQERPADSRAGLWWRPADLHMPVDPQLGLQWRGCSTMALPPGWACNPGASACTYRPMAGAALVPKLQVPAHVLCTQLLISRYCDGIFAYYLIINIDYGTSN